MKKMKTLTLNDTTFEIIDKHSREEIESIKKEKICNETVTEKTEVLNITWDGNVEGLVQVARVFFKVSDIIISNDDLRNADYIFGGSSMNFSSTWDSMISAGRYEISDDYAYVDSIVVVRSAWTLVPGIATFPEAGIYFQYNTINGSYVSSLSTKEAINLTEIKVDKIDKKYIPLDFLPHETLIVNITFKNNTYSTTMPPTDIVKAYNKGSRIIAKTPTGEYPMTNIIISGDTADCTFGGINGFSDGAPFIACYTVNQSRTVAYNQYSLT